MATATRSRDYIARPSRALLEAAVANPMVLYSEAKWQREVMGALRRFGWRPYHAWNSQHSAGGFPDICAIRVERRVYTRVRLLFAELKREDGKTTPEQEAWLADLGEAARAAYDMADEWRAELLPAPISVEVHVWRPSDWDKVLAVLA